MCQVLQGGKLDPPALSSLWRTLREMLRTNICGTAEEAAIQQESAEKFATKCLGMVMGRGIDSNKTRQSSRSVSTKQQAPRRGRRKARPKSRSNKEKVSHFAAPTLPPPWKPDKDVPKETAQATSSSADAGTSAELALCLREAYPDPKSMPESALKALTKVDVRSSKQTQLWLHLLPDELDIPKPAAPVTAREYNRVHASRNYRFKMIQRLCWRLFSRALPQPLKDDYTLLISIQVEAGQKTFTTGCPSCLTRRD